MNEGQFSKESVLFFQLLLTLHNAAMLQLGKLTDPATGQAARNIEQAKVTIDTLDMLKTKCKGNLSVDEDRFLQNLLSDLKLNFVDEMGRDVKMATPHEVESGGVEGNPG